MDYTLAHTRAWAAAAERDAAFEASQRLDDLPRFDGSTRSVKEWLDRIAARQAFAAGGA